MDRELEVHLSTNSSGGSPFLLCMYVFIAWILSHCSTQLRYQCTSDDCRTLIATVTPGTRKESPMLSSQQHSPTLRDCVYGQAVGDALGVPYEFRARGTFECTGMVGHGSHNQPAGTWSDDTSMALATCDSIRATGRVDVRDMRERFVRWYREGAYTVSGLFDIGGTTADALSSGRGRAGERDNGNGSLMRILPLAFTGATDDEVRAALYRTKGIGRWTADMFLIFHLGRPDVLPLEDGAVRQAFLWLYGVPITDPAAQALVCDLWHPNASIPVRYLYRALNQGLVAAGPAAEVLGL